MGRQRTSNGFTIVELLLVIVVVAILAAMTVIAFNGIQQRSRNSAKLSTVQSIVKVLSLYRVEHDAFPVTTNSAICLTLDNVCTTYNGVATAASNASLTSALSVYGTLPTSANDNSAGTYYGIHYQYTTTRTLESVANPLIIIFWLDGINQNCAGTVSGMVSVNDGSGTMTPAANARANTGTNQTRCYLMYPN